MKFAKNLEQQLSNNAQELNIPDFVTLSEKYKCNECKHCKYTETGSLRYIPPRTYTCEGEPTKRTQCNKRCWIFRWLFIIVTTIIIGIFSFDVFYHFQNLLLSFSYTIIFMVVMDIICCIIEYMTDKIFEDIEKHRRKKYDEKIANLQAINKIKKEETQKKEKQEQENEKALKKAKILYKEFSGEIKEKIKIYSKGTKEFPELKREFYIKYKEFLKNMENLLEEVTVENYDFSEIRILFQHRLPRMCEYIQIYIENVEEEESESEIQIKEFIKLFETFSAEMIRVSKNLKISDAEKFMYKVRALREVVSNANYEEEQQ